MTLEQDRARLAHNHVSAVKSEDEAKQKKFATVVHELTTLIHSAGPVRALECVDAFTNDAKKEQGTVLMDYLASQLKRLDPSLNNGADLRKRIREENDLQRYILFGRELQACLVWYRRCIQSILKINPTESASEDNE